MMLDLFKDNSVSFYTCTIILTVIALILATVYTVRNLMRLWSAGKPKPVDEMSEENDDHDVQENEIESSDDKKLCPFGKQTKKKVDGGGDVNTEDKLVEEEIDPVQYCEHIQSEVKKAKQRATMKQLGHDLTAEQMEEERRIQREQLQSIFKLMQEQEDKFGVGTVDEVQEQMKLYV